MFSELNWVSSSGIYCFARQIFDSWGLGGLKWEFRILIFNVFFWCCLCFQLRPHWQGIVVMTLTHWPWPLTWKCVLGEPSGPIHACSASGCTFLNLKTRLMEQFLTAVMVTISTTCLYSNSHSAHHTYHVSLEISLLTPEKKLNSH